MEEIKVAVAAARGLIREGMLSELDSAPKLTVAGEAMSARQVLELIDSAHPDVFILSATLPGEDPARLVSTLTSQRDIKVLVFGRTLSPDQIFEFLKCGATGYFSEDDPSGTLPKAVQAIHRGEMWVTRRLMARFFQSLVRSETQKQGENIMYPCGLSQREGEILYCLKKGYCNKDIANELCISEKTVKTHLGHIFRKLNVSQRLQAVIVAVEQDLT